MFTPSNRAELSQHTVGVRGNARIAKRMGASQRTIKRRLFDSGIDTNLRAIMDAWPTLPEADRLAVQAIVDATGAAG